MTVNPFTLSFNGLCGHLENRFHETPYFRSSRMIRTALIFTLVMAGLFALFGAVILSPVLIAPFMLLHLLTVGLVALFLSIPLLTRRQKYTQPAVVISAMIGGGALVIMVLAGPPAMRVTYDAGLVLIFMMIFLVIRLDFMYAAASGLGLLLFYGAAQVTWSPLGEDVAFTNLAFLFAAYVVCALAAYNLEFEARQRFFLACQLDVEKNKTNQTLVELETRVADRTQALSSVNTRLMLEIAERKQAQKEYVHLATHDSLTDLPNRTLMQDRLRHALSRARRNQQLLAVMFLDLDGFKAINDTYSHHSGDMLLQQVAKRLLTCLRENDTVSRFGGDEFVILIEGVTDESSASEVAKKILAAIQQPFNIDVAEVFISTSIGICIYPDHGDDPNKLLKNADIAMYRAKTLSKNSYQFFSESIAEKVSSRVILGSQLRRALAQNEFFLLYQPQVHLGTGRIVGVEALIRWRHPEEGLLPPSRFIPIAEENGLIVPLGEWTLRTACNQINEWRLAGHPPIRVAVNISGRQLKEPDFVERIASILSETCVPPELVELELTESVVFQYTGDNQTLLQRLKKHGVQLAVDDFGKGYSTLSHLAHLPFDTLKMDKVFADNIGNGSSDSVVASGIINIARHLGLTVVAEGVETSEQLMFYERQGCNFVQGWFFSRAVEPDRISEMLTQGLINQPQYIPPIDV